MKNPPRDRDAIVRDFHTVLRAIKHPAHEKESDSVAALERLLGDAVQPLPVNPIF